MDIKFGDKVLCVHSTSEVIHVPWVMLDETCFARRNNQMRAKETQKCKILYWNAQGLSQPKWWS